ncbi:MAG: hypothetical protein JWM88_1595 [Verrucomicrobia bacterium]|nr:hypothetical protein [Verrucomicrobiota bacterium]
MRRSPTERGVRKKHLWLVPVIALGIAVGLWWKRSQADRPAHARGGPAVMTATPSKNPVAIQDRRTIDFSSGRPVVKNSDDDKAIIDKAVKEMDAATKDITFGPTPAPAKK